MGCVRSIAITWPSSCVGTRRYVACARDGSGSEGAASGEVASVGDIRFVRDLLRIVSGSDGGGSVVAMIEMR